MDPVPSVSIGALLARLMASGTHVSECSVRHALHPCYPFFAGVANDNGLIPELSASDEYVAAAHWARYS